MTGKILLPTLKREARKTRVAVGYIEVVAVEPSAVGLRFA